MRLQPVVALGADLTVGQAIERLSGYPASMPVVVRWIEGPISRWFRFSVSIARRRLTPQDPDVPLHIALGLDEGESLEALELTEWEARGDEGFDGIVLKDGRVLGTTEVEPAAGAIWEAAESVEEVDEGEGVGDLDNLLRGDERRPIGGDDRYQEGDADEGRFAELLHFDDSDIEPEPEPAAAQPDPEPEPAAPPARYANVCLIDAALEPLTGDRPLRPGVSYTLRLDIGPLSAESVVENPGAFPADLLPRTEDGHWLEVVAASDQFDIGMPRAHLFLPNRGRSWSCACEPETAHDCAPESREAHVLIPVVTPSRPSVASIRIGVYFRKNLVQSQLLTARVGEDTEPGPDGPMGYTSVIDYSLTAALGDVGFLEPRTANILTNRNADGSHTVVVNGDEVLAFVLSEGQVRAAIDAARASLRALHIRETKTRLSHRIDNLYDERNAKGTDAFIDDLRIMAGLGWQLWTALLQTQPDWRRRLRGALRDPEPIQVSRPSGAHFVFPWALVYDIPLAGRPDDFSVCQVVHDWSAGRPPNVELLVRCPHEADHAGNTICPFGFWGIRHAVEQPPSMPEGHPLATDIPVDDGSIDLVVGFSPEMNRPLTDQHLDDLGRLLDSARLVTTSSHSGLRELLGREGIEILYLYCHGRRAELPGSDESVPFLEFTEEETVRPSDLVAWHDGFWPEGHWQHGKPLVFINGCHTAELAPDTLVNFVDGFAGINAAGIIGTEVTLHQQVAGEVGLRFLEHFGAGKSVGEALRRVRLELLVKGNLMGLAYTPYCSLDLKLAVG